MLKPVYGMTLALALAAACALPAFAQAPAGQPPLKRDHHMRPAFSDIDGNKDGMISQAEFDAFKPHKPDGLDGPPPGGPGGPGGGKRFFHHRGPPDLKTLDVNNDGKVTLEEFSAPIKDHFQKLDANSDGILSADELKAPPFEDGPDGPPPPPEK